MESQDFFKQIAEASIKMLLVSSRNLEEVKPGLLQYVENNLDELREFYKRHQGFDPLIVMINDKYYVFNMRNFIEDPISPLFETTEIKIQ